MRYRASGLIVTLGVLLTLCGCQQPREAGESNAPPGAPTGRPEGPADRAGEAVGDAAHTIGQAASNATLTAKVKNALLLTKGLETGKLDVDTTGDGVVSLKGSVPSSDQKMKAEKMAKGVDGVKKVVNQLKVAR
jgi:hyperosmotically inducible periplasmic protein